jgi:manganese transport protein
LLLWVGSPKVVANTLSVVVAAMGVAFLPPPRPCDPIPATLATSLVLPSLPEGSGLLVLALVGTTVVPYNLFLGSGLAQGRELAEVRFGLGVAILLGGVVSMGVLVVGAAVEGPFTFEGWPTPSPFGWDPGRPPPGRGALRCRLLLGHHGTPGRGHHGPGSLRGRTGRWRDGAWRYRMIWGGVLGVGLAFGIAGVQPIPVIILAQALNGILLPFAAVFLLLAVNDRGLMGSDALNGPISNVLMVLVTAVTVVLGASSLFRAGYRAVGAGAPDERMVLVSGLAVGLILAAPVYRSIRHRR